MTSKVEMNEALIDAIGAHLDPDLATSGFVRARRSFTYLRKCREGDQALHVFAEFKPSYDPKADSHLYPQIKMCFPELNRVALNMIETSGASSFDSKVTFSQPVDFVIPKEHHIGWYARGREGVFECVRSIRTSVITWVIPFLNEYTTVESLTVAYDKHDERFGWHRTLYVYVAAAFILLGKPENAMGLLEDVFRTPGAKRQYSKAFSFVAAELTRK